MTNNVNNTSFEQLDVSALKFDQAGLVPAVLQDAASGQVLMQAFMNLEALSKTIETGSAWFYSRSRAELWHKGATSGNYQYVQRILADCDSDSLLLLVNSAGPACHTNRDSCFYKEIWIKNG